jgi:hypothetical protein
MLYTLWRWQHHKLTNNKEQIYFNFLELVLFHNNMKALVGENNIYTSSCNVLKQWSVQCHQLRASWESFGRSGTRDRHSWCQLSQQAADSVMHNTMYLQCCTQKVLRSYCEPWWHIMCGRTIILWPCYCIAHLPIKLLFSAKMPHMGHIPEQTVSMYGICLYCPNDSTSFRYLSHDHTVACEPLYMTAHQS